MAIPILSRKLKNNKILFIGECEGTRVSGIQPSNTREQCLAFCKEIEECKWFTFLIEFQVNKASNEKDFIIFVINAF